MGPHRRGQVEALLTTPSSRLYMESLAPAKPKVPKHKAAEGPTPKPAQKAKAPVKKKDAKEAKKDGEESSEDAQSEPEDTK